MSKPVRHGDKWRIRWTNARGQRQSAVFDEFRTAQTELARNQAEAADIRRGRLAQIDPDKTCNDLFDYWLDKRALHKRSQKDDVSIIRAHLRPFFGKMRVMDVGVEDGDDYISEKDDLSPKTIANHVTLLKTMLNVAANVCPRVEALEQPVLQKIAEQELVARDVPEQDRLPLLYVTVGQRKLNKSPVSSGGLEPAIDDLRHVAHRRWPRTHSGPAPRALQQIAAICLGPSRARP